MSFQPTQRQQSEISFHKSHAEKNADAASRPVTRDIVDTDRRRWWNAYWATYSLLRGRDLKGRKVLVAGCGFGEDAIRLSYLGAEVYAFDISPDIIDITRERVANLGIDNIDLRVMPSESMDYEDNFFDGAFFMDILHHVDIPSTIREIKRVVRSGGEVIGDELYTHSFIQKNIRESWLVQKLLYPRMQKYVYDNTEPYITDDEHKIDEQEFQYVRDLCSDIQVEYYNIFVGRIFPLRFTILAKIDRLLAIPFLGGARYFAGRVVFAGTLK